MTSPGIQNFLAIIHSFLTPLLYLSLKVKKKITKPEHPDLIIYKNSGVMESKYVRSSVYGFDITSRPLGQAPLP